MSAEPVNFSDIQGLVRFGYSALTEASFLLLKISDAAAARAWLMEAPVSTAEELSRPPLTALQVAFTCEGITRARRCRRIACGDSPPSFNLA